MNIILVFLFLAAVLAGLGHHLWDVQVAEYEKLAKVCWDATQLPTISTAN